MQFPILFYNLAELGDMTFIFLNSFEFGFATYYVIRVSTYSLVPVKFTLLQLELL